MRRCLPLLALLLVGCHSAPPPVPASTFSPSLAVDLGIKGLENQDPKFVLTSTDPAKSAVVLWDGELGVNVGPFGLADDLAGKSLPAFRPLSFKQELQYWNHESPNAQQTKALFNEDILPLSNPLALTITADGQPLSPIKEGYSQSLDLRDGALTTHWFAPLKSGYLEVRISELISNGLYLYMEFHGPKGTVLSVLPPAMSSTPASNMVFGDFEPRTLNGRRSNGDVWSLSNARQRAEVMMDTGVATWASYHTWMPAALAGNIGHGEDWKNLLSTAYAKLSGPKAPSIEIDGPLADQQAVNSFLYYLRTGLPKEKSMQISPFGLSTDRYNGHVFWDADVWVMPALAFLEPSILQGLANYRLSRIQPPPNAPFPWESSLTGKETAPGDSKKEIHISGSVLWGLEFEKSLGAKVPDGVIKRVADYYTSRATKRPDGKLAFLNVMSPDESHIGANDLYTNLVAQWAMNGATWTPAQPAPSPVYLPADATSFLTYDNDALRGYKQAAAVLSIYPLQFPPAEAQAKTMLERFQSKVTAHGPAMSDSVHALIWARLGEPDKAYDLWEKSWTEFVQGPELMFSEKRGVPTGYFMTGAAGSLQTVLYGFLGFRVDEKPLPDADWKIQLKNNRWLSIKPHLPSQWKGITLHNFYILGKPYTLTVKKEGAKTVTSIHQGDYSYAKCCPDCRL